MSVIVFTKGVRDFIKRTIRRAPVVRYRLMGAVDRRQEEEIRRQILLKLLRRMKNGK